MEVTQRRVKEYQDKKSRKGTTATARSGSSNGDAQEENMRKIQNAKDGKRMRTEDTSGRRREHVGKTVKT